MKCKFKVLTRGIDSESDRFKLSGVSYKDEIPLLYGHLFDVDNYVCMAKLKKVTGGIQCTADIPDRLLDTYPCINFLPIRTRKHKGVRLIQECRIFGVSLCAAPNADRSIKTIREQIKTPKQE